MSKNREYDAIFFGLISRVSPWRQFKYSLKSIKRFFYDVWWFRGSDYTSTLTLLKTSMEEQLRIISKDDGFKEVDEFRIPKEDNLKRCIEIIKNIQEDNYDDRCGYDYDYKLKSKPIEGKEGYSELYTTATAEQNINNDKALIEGAKLAQEELDELAKIISDPMSGIKTWWK